MNRLRRSALKVDQPVMQPIMRSRSFTRGVLNLVERFRFGFYGAKRCLYTLLGPLSLDLHFFTRPPEIGLSALPGLPRTAGFPFFKHEFGRAALELNDLALQRLGTPSRIGFGFLRSRYPISSIASVHLFKGANKLAVYFENEKSKYMVIVIKDTLYETFAKDLISRGDRIAFSFSTAEEEEEIKKKKK